MRTGRRFSVCLAMMCLLIPLGLKAQLSVTISQQFNACDRVLTANVSGGSGNYQYAWGVSGGGCSVPANASPPSITITPTQCNTQATYNVFVQDLNTSSLAYAQVSFPKFITGSFSVYVYNVFTPNGDGINDTFRVDDANQGAGPLNAHTLNIVVYNRWGKDVHNQTFTNYLSGLNGGLAVWNGGGLPSGTYYWAINVSNCSNSTSSYNGYVQLLM